MNIYSKKCYSRKALLHKKQQKQLIHNMFGQLRKTVGKLFRQLRKVLVFLWTSKQNYHDPLDN